jgi:hypothetical protein
VPQLLVYVLGIVTEPVRVVVSVKLISQVISITYSQLWKLRAVISATQEVEIKRIAVQGQPGKIVSRASPQSISWAWWCTL